MQRDFDGARKRYEQILAKDPHNEQALLALADLLVATNAPPAEVKAAIDRAIAANPTSVRARLALDQLSTRNSATRRRRSPRRRPRTAAIPGQSAVLEALGVAQQAAARTTRRSRR